MGFDINNAVADDVDESPVSSGGFDIGNAIAEPEQNETSYVAETGDFVSAPSGFNADEVSMLNDVQNNGQSKSSYFGMKKLSRGATNFFASTPQIVGSEAVRLGEDIQDGKQQTDINIAEAVFPAVKFFSMVKDVAKIFPAYNEAEKNISEQLVKSGQSLIDTNKAFLEKNNLTKQEGDGLLYDVGSGFASVGTSIGLLMVTKNPIATSALFSEMQRSSVYVEARDAGKSPEASRNISNVAGLAEGVIEAVGGKVFIDVAGGMVKKIAVRSLSEGIQEGTQSAGESVVLQSSGVREVDIEGAAEGATYSFLLGVLIGAPVNTIATTIEQESAKKGLSKEQSKKLVADLIAEKDNLETEVSQSMENESNPLARDESADAESAEVIRKFQAGEDIDVSNISPDIIAEMNSIVEQTISEQDRNNASATAENQIIEQEATQQAEIVTEAESVKTQIDSIPDVDINNPTKVKKILGYVPESISQFIRKNGGINDAGGDFKSQGLDKKMVGLINKGKEGTANDTNASIDKVKERVFDAGYFPDKSDYNEISNDELLRSVDNDLTGIRQYTSDDTNKINEALGGFDGANKALFERGLDRGMSVDQIADVIREERDLGKFNPREKVDIDDVIEKSDPTLKVAFDKAVETKKEEDLIFEAPPELSYIKRGAKELGLGLSENLTPISTRIKNIAPQLSARLRRFEFDIKKKILKDNDAVTPLIAKMRSLPDDVYSTLDIAMKNRDIDTINLISEAYDMKKEIDAARKVFDGIYKRATDAGIEINYLEDLFPRRIENLDGLMTALGKKTETGSIIKDALSAKKESLGRELTKDEKANVIDTLLRGYSVDGISLAKRGIFKERTIEQVTNELNQYYYSTEEAMMAYIYSSNESIETNIFFGKKGSEGFAVNAEESIGAMTADLVDSDQINDEQAKQLQSMLNARFDPAKMGEVMSTIRDLGYIATMGSPLNAVTQIGDLATSMYNAGFLNAIQTLPRALTDKTRITLADIGFQDRVAQEFDNQNKTAKAVSKVFEVTGLNKIDRVGKLNLVNSSLLKAEKQARKNDPKLMAKLEHMFADGAEQVRQDLANKNITEDVKYFTFSELLDFQPVALSEMPEGYLRAKKGKMFYMLKSFTIKQIDVYRRDVYQEISDGVKNGDKAQVIQGMTNFIRLVGYWTVMNASSDFIKDYIKSFFGDSEIGEPEDYVVENIYKAFGLSKYTFDQMAKPFGGSTPANAAFDLILPPTKTMNNMWFDYKKIQKDGLESVDQLRTIRSIPVAGELYYFWFGGGSGKEDKKKSEVNF